jgi:chromate transporter
MINTNDPESLQEAANMQQPSMLEALLVWWKVGILSFGGPAAQIALMHRMVVSERGWLSEKQYLNALNFCMLLPGPEAMQLATYAGWHLHGAVGGLIAGGLFVLPGAVVVATLAWVYVSFGQVPLVDALFLGVKAAVLVIVIEALIKVSKRALKGREHYMLAALAFTGIFFFQLPYPLIVLAVAVYGFFRLSSQDSARVESANVSQSSALQSNTLLSDVSLRNTLQTTLTWLAIWWLPLLALWLLGGHEILAQLAVFFSKLAVVTFGGAYAVLAYMAQDVVTQFNWLSAGEMMDGLGLAETTPGPLILVTEFVGFLAGYREGGFLLALASALVVLWVTFVPCFLWIFACAPYIEWLSEQVRLKSALSAITAAVVGVILNLSLWFSLHVLFSVVNPVKHGPLTLWLPELATLDWRVVVLALISGVLLLKLHWNVLWVLLVAALGGVLLSL